MQATERTKHFRPSLQLSPSSGSSYPVTPIRLTIPPRTPMDIAAQQDHLILQILGFLPQILELRALICVRRSDRPLCMAFTRA